MTQNIPKVIHYAWFGNNEKPNSVKKYISLWEKVLPDYEIIEWNEKNFNINKYIYCKEAYEAKKFAFVTDVVRLHVLYNYGGIYMDTDVEVLRPLDNFLQHEGFSGFETEDEIPTGIIGAKKGNKWVRDQLSYYNNRHFINEDGSLNLTTNVDTITKISTIKHGFIPNGKYQLIKYDFALYPKDYFCPKSPLTGEIELTENSYTIHHFSGTWTTKSNKIHKKIYYYLIKIFGRKNADIIKKYWKKN